MGLRLLKRREVSSKHCEHTHALHTWRPMYRRTGADIRREANADISRDMAWTYTHVQRQTHTRKHTNKKKRGGKHFFSLFHLIFVAFKITVIYSCVGCSDGGIACGRLKKKNVSSLLLFHWCYCSSSSSSLVCDPWLVAVGGLQVWASCMSLSPFLFVVFLFYLNSFVFLFFFVEADLSH